MFPANGQSPTSLAHKSLLFWDDEWVHLLTVWILHSYWREMISENHSAVRKDITQALVPNLIQWKILFWSISWNIEVFIPYPVILYPTLLYCITCIAMVKMRYCIVYLMLSYIHWENPSWNLSEMLLLTISAKLRSIYWWKHRFVGATIFGVAIQTLFILFTF